MSRLRPLRLLGVMLLLIGCSILVSAPSRAFLDAPFGWLTLMAAALLLTFRNYIEVDRDGNRVGQRIGFGYAFALRAFPLDSIRRLTLTSELVRSGKKTHALYGVKMDGQPGAWLYQRENPADARLIAERLSRALKVDLETRLFGASSIRHADELDMPLAQRWQRAGLHKEAPTPGATSGLVVRHESDCSELILPGEKGPRLVAALLGIGILVVLGGLCMLRDAPYLFLAMLAAATVSMIGGFILQSSGDIVLRFNTEFVDLRYGLLPRRRMKLAEIEELLDSDRGVVLIGDQRSLELSQPTLAGDRLILRQFVERQIAQRQPTQK